MEKKNLQELRTDYSKAELTLDMTQSDPFAQFSIWFKNAGLEGEIDPNAMVLATVDQNMQPSARVVLLKEISETGFIFYTNFNSRKGQELAMNQKCALTFWWRKLQQQVRIEGIVEKVPDSKASEYFEKRPLGSQRGAIVSPQSQVIRDRTFLMQKLEEEIAKHPDATYLEKPAHWGGYLVVPHTIEFWQGRANRLHDRLRYKRTGDSWEIDRLAP